MLVEQERCLDCGVGERMQSKWGPYTRCRRCYQHGIFRVRTYQYFLKTACPDLIRDPYWRLFCAATDLSHNVEDLSTATDRELLTMGNVGPVTVAAFRHYWPEPKRFDDPWRDHAEMVTLNEGGYRAWPPYLRQPKPKPVHVVAPPPPPPLTEFQTWLRSMARASMGDASSVARLMLDDDCCARQPTLLDLLAHYKRAHTRGGQGSSPEGQARLDNFTQAYRDSISYEAVSTSEGSLTCQP